METEFAKGMREYIDILSPWFLIIATLFGVIYGLWTKSINDRLKRMELIIEKEHTERKLREKEKQEECDRCKERILAAVKEANFEMLTNFQEGIRVEREFRLGVMNEQRTNIAKLFERIDEISIMITDIKTTQDDSIAHQKEICALRHEKN